MKRILHAFLLVLALLFVQAGAVAHAASHTGGKALPADSVCELCVGYAQMAGNAPLSVRPGLPVCEARHQRPEAVVHVFSSRTIFHTRARAPPVHFV